MQINVNGRSHEVDVEPDMPLLWVLRDVMGLTGTKYGCGIAQCGSCTVHLDGEAVRSCSLPVSAVAGKRVVTIEGLSRGQLAPRAEGMGRARRAAVRLLPVAARSWPRRRCCAKNPQAHATRTSTTAMTNICRCGTYQRIRAAIHMAAGTGKGGGSIIHMAAGTETAAADGAVADRTL